MKPSYEELEAQTKQLKIDADCYKNGMEASNARLVQLAAENVGLKAGASYFSYGSEHNFECHKTAAEAVEAAEAAIDDYRGDACDGWSEEVDSVCWGIIMQSSTKVGERPRNDEDRCDPAIDTICDYALLPNIKTPATDAFLAEVRAQARNELIDELEARFTELSKSSPTPELRSGAAGAAGFVSTFRKGVQS
ncbi:TPA: hypothetical protein ACIFST_004172 [Citrobacter farmeri]